MKNSKLIIYDNPTANFRLSVDTMLVKIKTDGTESELVYVNEQKGTGTFRPSVFLVFTYLTDSFETTKGVYTSFQHMYKIRSIFSQMNDLLMDPNAYMMIEGNLAVSPDEKYKNPLVVDGIGKNADWISLSLATYADNTTAQLKPAVALQISKSDGYSSLLSIDEFQAIVDTIMHIDLLTLASNAVTQELISKYSSTTARQAQAPVQYQSAQPKYGTRAPAPQPAPRSYAHYQNGSFNRPASAPQPAAPASRTLPARKPVEVAPAPVQPAPQPAQPVASTKPKFTAADVDNVDVSDIEMNINDDDIVNTIFSGTGE